MGRTGGARVLVPAFRATVSKQLLSVVKPFDFVHLAAVDGAVQQGRIARVDNLDLGMYVRHQLVADREMDLQLLLTELIECFAYLHVRS